MSWMRCGLLVMSCSWGVGCGERLPPLQVPQALEAVSERFEVSGHVGLLRHTVQFGPYRATSARVGVQHPTVQKPTLFNGLTERVENHQAGSFELLTPEGARFQAECQKHRRLVKKHEQKLAPALAGVEPVVDGKVVSASETFRCSLARPNGTPMQLFIIEGASGLVQAEDVELSFLAVNPAADQPALTWKDSAGFLIADGTRELAAVDLTDAPAVTLRRDLPLARQDELAAVCMALLLLRHMF